MPSLDKITPTRQDKTSRLPNRRFKLDERSQLFTRAHISVAAMRVSIPSILFKQFLQLLV
jgi:hypothetical protein